MSRKHHSAARALLAAAAAAVLLTAAACNSDVCDDLETRTFRATTDAECGLGTGGGGPVTVMCHWTIAFNLRRFTWNYSDVQESGSYSCDGSTLRGDGDSGQVYAGSYDADTGLLIWEGREYREQ